ncbi:hypothetical protein D1007_56557 [Hordeum vulgare]|nr:hypothetical protein D1007_56557 [Hordeum vulgare]
MAESDEESVDNLPEMQCLPDEMVRDFSSTKRSLLDTLEKAESKKKGKFQEGSTKWGPVLSIRPNTRGHGDLNIMDKAKAYQHKKNLEIPKSFKGNSFSSLDNHILADQARKIDIHIGNGEPEQNAIIDDMIGAEKLRCLQFADLNPEIVLPDNLDVIIQNQCSPGDTIPSSRTVPTLLF